MRIQASGERGDLTRHDMTRREERVDELSSVRCLHHHRASSAPISPALHKANATFTRRKHSKRLTGTNRAVGGLTRYHVNTANSRRDLLIPKNCLSFVAREILDILERSLASPDRSDRGLRIRRAAQGRRDKGRQYPHVTNSRGVTRQTVTDRPRHLDTCPTNMPVLFGSYACLSSCAAFGLAR
jgi:hypothetical protein